MKAPSWLDPKKVLKETPTGFDVVLPLNGGPLYLRTQFHRPPSDEDIWTKLHQMGFSVRHIPSFEDWKSGQTGNMLTADERTGAAARMRYDGLVRRGFAKWCADGNGDPALTASLYAYEECLETRDVLRLACSDSVLWEMAIEVLPAFAVWKGEIFLPDWVFEELGRNDREFEGALLDLPGIHKIDYDADSAWLGVHSSADKDMVSDAVRAVVAQFVVDPNLKPSPPVVGADVPDQSADGCDHALRSEGPTRSDSNREEGASPGF